MAGQDYYEVLGVSKNDDTARIKAAYRDLALKYHPDRNQGNPGAQDRMMAVNEAYAVLSDPEKRRNYDGLQQQYGPSRGYTHFRQAYSDQDIFSGTDIHKVFEEMAKSFGVRNFEEISKEFYGKTNAFEFKNSRGHFKGFFFSGTMGPGTAFSKANGPGLLGRAARTLLGRITGGQLPDQDLNRRDTIRIDPGLARRGGPYAYYHKWRDKKLVVTIPPGIRQGQKIRLRGMGREDKGRSGDLYLEIHTKSSLMDAIRRILPFR